MAWNSPTRLKPQRSVSSLPKCCRCKCAPPYSALPSTHLCAVLVCLFIGEGCAQHLCGGQRTPNRGQFSFPARGFQGPNSDLSGLASTSPYPSHLDSPYPHHVDSPSRVSDFFVDYVGSGVLTQGLVVKQLTQPALYRPGHFPRSPCVPLETVIPLAKTSSKCSLTNEI